MNLNDKVVLVTGASSGIGAAIAKSFSKQGAKVAIVGRNEEKLKNVAEECENLGSKPLVILADVTKDPDAKRIVETTVSQLGKLDVLVNNAGIGGMTGIRDENALQVFDQVMNTNLRAVVYVTHLATPHIVETKGNIINISSIASSQITNNKMFPYCTSKAALDHFTRCVALELAPKGVRCNSINPGPVWMDILTNSSLDEQQDITSEKMKKYTALDRIGDAEEIADLAIFLASDKAKGMTGSSFVSDNGMLLMGGQS